MERNGFHTPKKSRFNPKKSNLNINNNSPIHSILRRQSFIPPKTIQSFNNKHYFHKDSFSNKKHRRRNFSGETIPEEKENISKDKGKKVNPYGNKSERTKKIEDVDNDYFSNITKNIFTNESHFDKNYIIRSPRKMNNNSKSNFYISTKSLFNNTPRRMSAINSDFVLSNMNQRKNTDNINLNMNKDGLTINSNYKAPGLNRKLFEKVDNLLHKKKLTKDETEFVLNYYEKGKERECSPKHKMSNINMNSPRMRKKQKKNRNNSVKFKEQSISIENEKKETLKTQNDQDNNNIIISEINPKKQRFKWLNVFLCCFKTN